MRRRQGSNSGPSWRWPRSGRNVRVTPCGWRHTVSLWPGVLAEEMPIHSQGLEIVAGVDVTYLLGSR
jgi:hypothetical protein